MFALIKYGVGCTLSIKHTLLDWSWKLVPRCGLAGSSASGPVLFCLSCFCMRVHAGALLSFERDTCMRVGFVGFGRACALVSARDTGHMQAHCFRSGGTRWRADVHACCFGPGTRDACWRVGFGWAGCDGARWVGGQVSTGRFRWFRAHFCHRALAAAETNFSARFFFPCLFKHAALSSSHLPHPES